MSDIDLDALEALANAASPGPWDGSFMEPDGRYELCAGGPPQPVPPGQDGKWVADWLATFDWQDGDAHEGPAVNEANAAFVAAARTAVPSLIARVRESEQRAAKAEAQVAALVSALRYGVRSHEPCDPDGCWCHAAQPLLSDLSSAAESYRCAVRNAALEEAAFYLDNDTFHESALPTIVACAAKIRALASKEKP